MSCLLGVTVTQIAIDVSMAFTAFFAGFVAAIIYFRVGAFRNLGALESDPDDFRSPEAVANDAARTSMAAQQLRDLAHNVAADIGAHNVFVEGIACQLGEISEGDVKSGATVMQAVGQMLDANDKLQARLADAERKIQVQAEEIRSQQFEARTDALTKLANRRAFDAFLDECQEKSGKSDRPFSLIMLDVDNFKQFNDTHGHPAGDEVLRTVGRTLNRTVKSGDLACRYGGEEFAAILVNTNAADAQLAAERIRKAIEAMSVPFGGNTLRVTASVGMAASLPEEEVARLVRRADEAVYGSKKNSKNCSFWHDGRESLLIAATSKTPAVEVAVAPSNLANLKPNSAKVWPNRTAFADELGRRIAESHRFGFPLTLLHFRMRNFRKLENAYGNAVSALLVDSLASFIQSTLRDMDLLAKLDGGELIVMLPGSSASAAKIVGQRVRTSISLCPIPLGEQQIRLELDMGIASVQTDDDAMAAMESAREEMEAATAAEATEQEVAELAAM